jgi:heat shock protein HtpX
MSAAATPAEAMIVGSWAYFYAYKVDLRALRKTPSPQMALAPLLLLPVVVVFLVIGEVCMVLTAIFSRMREFEADAGAARLTGNPSALASALIAIDGNVKSIPKIDLRQAASLDVFHIVAMQHESAIRRTHPTLRRRLAALNKIEGRLQSSR